MLQFFNEEERELFSIFLEIEASAVLLGRVW